MLDLINQLMTAVKKEIKEKEQLEEKLIYLKSEMKFIYRENETLKIELENLKKNNSK